MLHITKGNGFTAFDWSEKMQDFVNTFYNGNELLETIPEMKECTTFEDHGHGRELLIYKDETIIYSCMYDEIGINKQKNGKCTWIKIIKNVYSRKGCHYEINPWEKYKDIIH